MCPWTSHFPWLFPNTGWEQPREPLPTHHTGSLGILGGGGFKG